MPAQKVRRVRLSIGITLDGIGGSCGKADCVTEEGKAGRDTGGPNAEMTRLKHDVGRRRWGWSKEAGVEGGGGRGRRMIQVRHYDQFLFIELDGLTQ
jgi:hypothetical protein